MIDFDLKIKVESIGEIFLVLVFDFYMYNYGKIISMYLYFY